jgi:hypothetical protein
MITMHALKTVVILIAMNMILVNTKKLPVMTIMNVLMIIVVLSMVVFTLIIHTNVSPQIIAMTQNVNQAKDASSLILLTDAMILTNVMTSPVIQMLDVFTAKSSATITMLALMTPAIATLDVFTRTLKILMKINVLNSIVTKILVSTIPL